MQNQSYPDNNYQPLPQQQDSISIAERLFQQGRFAESENAFCQILAADPANCRARNGLGTVLWHQNRRNDSVAQFAESLRIEPDNRDATWNIGQILLVNGATEKAVQLYSSYLKIHPDEHSMAQAVQQIAEFLAPSKTIWFLAPDISQAELADIKTRFNFYLPDRPWDMVKHVAVLPSEVIVGKDTVMLFGDLELVPEQVKKDNKRFYDIDHRRCPVDGWNWARLAGRYSKDPLDKEKTRLRFKSYVDMLRSQGLTKSYLFATGPSLEKAIERDWSDGYRVVCNTIVRDRELWNHINPHFIVAGDGIYHFGHTALPTAFRRDLKKRLAETNTFFLYPDLFHPIVSRELKEFSHRLVPVPSGGDEAVNKDLSIDFALPGLGNVIGLLLLPLGCTLSKDVYLWGFDGRAPDDKYFWGNSNKHSYTELIPELKEQHQGFFDHFAPKSDPKWYTRSFLGETLDRVLTQAENEGYSFTMMHKSFTPTLAKRCSQENGNMEHSAHRSPSQQPVIADSVLPPQPEKVGIPDNLPVPWSPQYTTYHTHYLTAALSNTTLRDVFGKGQQLPENYGLGLDERCIELPWFFSVASPNAKKYMDAGSALNHEYVIGHPYWSGKNLTIVTLAPEHKCFWSAGVSYNFSDLRNTPFKDGYFDEIACISTLEHIGMNNFAATGNSRHIDSSTDDYKLALRELHRILKPGGRLLLTVPFGRRENYGLFQQFDKDLLDQASEAFGAVGRQDRFYRYTSSGWRLSDDPQECANLDYSTYALKQWGVKIPSRQSESNVIIPAAAAVACCLWQRDSKCPTNMPTAGTVGKSQTAALDYANVV